MAPDIPEEKLPQCWSDDVRMNALFAPFRLKAANPESWEMKMKFWSDMLRVWCCCTGDPVVSAADAKVAFQRNGRTPACIDIVVEEMFQSGELVPLSKYQQILQQGREGWVRWGARLAFKPAALALTAVSSLLPGRQLLDNDGLPKASIDSTQKFVMESVLKEQASSLLDSYPPGLERVGTMAEVMARCGWPASRAAFEMALGCLVDAGRAAVRGDVVKLAEPNHKVSDITETDEALVMLKSAEARLEGDAGRLSRDLAAADADARAALALGNRVAAKKHLRRRRGAAARLARCGAARENVRALLQQMTDVAQNAAIVDTYRTAASALRRDMTDHNLDEDTVNETIEDLNEVMQTYSEMEKALAGAVLVDDDMEDLEAELKELVASGGDGAGGSPEAKLASPAGSPTKPPRKISEREFIFDGEERILAELNELGVEEAGPPVPARPLGRNPARSNYKQPVRNWTEVAEKNTRKAVKQLAREPWRDSEWNNNSTEIRTDERLHPGQPLNIDFSSPPLYSHEFVVRDHRAAGGVWLYNDNDDQLRGTEYTSSESPGKSGGSFQMAPGGERRRDSPLPADRNMNGAEPSPAGKEPATESQPPVAEKEPEVKPSDFDDLERRLKNLRG